MRQSFSNSIKSKEMKAELKQKVFINGKIFTSNPKRPYADCFAVKDGRITFIGDSSDLPEYDCEIVDLKDRKSVV